MPLTSRKPRPLKRENREFRDDRLIIIACDDTYAPKQYFNFFKIPRVHVHVVETVDGTSSAPMVLSRLLDVDHEEDDELWLVLDVDHCAAPNHAETFVDAIKDARRRGVRVALSNPCFELWLLVHHVDEAEVIRLNGATEVEQKLRNVLGEYNKTNLKSEHYPLTKIAAAYERAKSLAASAGGGDRPDNNKTDIYQLVYSIVANGLQSRLPEQLASIIKSGL